MYRQTDGQTDRWINPGWDGYPIRFLQDKPLVCWWCHLMTVAEFDDIQGWRQCKVMVRQRWPAQREDKRAAQGEATQQPAGAMGGREGGAAREKRDTMRQSAGTTRWREGGVTRWLEGSASRGDATTSRREKEDKSEAQQENEERQCNNKLAQQEDKRVAQQEDDKRKCDINFKCAITVVCSEPMPLKEELPLYHLDD